MRENEVAGIQQGDRDMSPAAEGERASQAVDSDPLVPVTPKLRAASLRQEFEAIASATTSPHRLA